MTVSLCPPQGDYEQAIRLYLKGGLPAQAGRILNERTVENQAQLLETVASTLSATGMHDRAGEFYEKMNQLQRAMDRCGAQEGTMRLAALHAFCDAIELVKTNQIFSAR